MSRQVQCVLLKREAPGLERVPYPGDLGRPPALLNPGGWTNSHLRSVVKQNAQLFDIVDRLAA